MRLVSGLVVIAVLLAAGLSTAEVPAAAAITATPNVEVIPPATGPGVMSGGIATSSHIIELRSDDRRAAKARAVSIPKGWKSYSYDGVTISVPKSWAVKHNTNCPNTSAPGALLLGYPKTPYHCPAYQYAASYVTIHGTMGAMPPAGAPVTVNGLRVDVGFGSPTSLDWFVPSLGLLIFGEGLESDRILHTVRRS